MDKSAYISMIVPNQLHNSPMVHWQLMDQLAGIALETSNPLNKLE